MCTTPAYPYIDQVNVSISSNGQDDGVALSSVATFSYYAASSVTRVFPDFSSSRGGARISLMSSVVPVTGEAPSCRFNTTVVAGTRVSPSLVTCITPPHENGAVLLSFAHNGVDFTPVMSQFNFYALPHVTHIVPMFGSAEGGTVVTVHGRAFPNSDQLKCRFSNENSNVSVAARWISST
jgi:hypothetical protein